MSANVPSVSMLPLFDGSSRIYVSAKEQGNVALSTHLRREVHKRKEERGSDRNDPHRIP